MEKIIFVFTDGGARGNPGPAAIGFIIKDSRGKILTEQGKFIGRATNNVAEYQAVIEALKWLHQNVQMFHSEGIRRSRQCSNVQMFLDSKLVVNQLNGLFKIKNKNLRNLVVEVRKLEKETGGNIFYNLIPRQKNKRADFLVNFALKRSNP